MSRDTQSLELFAIEASNSASLLPNLFSSPFARPLSRKTVLSDYNDVTSDDIYNNIDGLNVSPPCAHRFVEEGHTWRDLETQEIDANTSRFCYYRTVSDRIDDMGYVHNPTRTE